MAIIDMEKIADQVDGNDKGSTSVCDEYERRCRPYMRSYSVTPNLTYQVIMSPLMSAVLAQSE